MGVRTKWRKGNQKALYFIGTSIAPELQIHVDNVTTAREAWTALKDQFQRVSLMQKIRLRKQYYRLELQYRDDIHEHIRKLCELLNQMKELGEDTNDKDLAMSLLASLPFERYQSLIVSLDVKLFLRWIVLLIVRLKTSRWLLKRLQLEVLLS